MNKKLFGILLCIVLMMVCVCALAENEPLVIKTNNYALFDMTRTIAADKALVEYVPEAALDTLGECDLFICQGGAQDAWTADLKDTTLVKAVDSVETMADEADVLVIPINCILVATDLAALLGEMDEQNAAVYQDNYLVYQTDMILLDDKIRESLYEGAEFSCEEVSLVYFVGEYGVSVVAPGEGVIPWNAYYNPAEEDLNTPYAQLLERNLSVIAEAKANLE